MIYSYFVSYIYCKKELKAGSGVFFTESKVKNSDSFIKLQKIVEEKIGEGTTILNFQYLGKHER